MRKIGVILLCILSGVFANSYNFLETRYSDALDKSIQHKGVITFSEGLHIEYKDSSKSLVYEDEEVALFEDGEPIALGTQEAMQLANYFAIISLLYSGDTQKIEGEFIVTEFPNKTLLVPKGELAKYMFKIELQKEQNRLKKIGMFLSNYDTITINILDEIQ